MEVVFANYEFAWPGEWNVCKAIGRLSLLEGEGEGEGFLQDNRRMQAPKTPSPYSSPLNQGERRERLAC